MSIVEEDLLSARLETWNLGGRIIAPVAVMEHGVVTNAPRLRNAMLAWRSGRLSTGVLAEIDDLIAGATESTTHLPSDVAAAVRALAGSAHLVELASAGGPLLVPFWGPPLGSSAPPTTVKAWALSNRALADTALSIAADRDSSAEGLNRAVRTVRRIPHDMAVLYVRAPSLSGALPASLAHAPGWFVFLRDWAWPPHGHGLLELAQVAYRSGPDGLCPDGSLAASSADVRAIDVRTAPPLRRDPTPPTPPAPPAPSVQPVQPATSSLSPRPALTAASPVPVGTSDARVVLRMVPPRERGAAPRPAVGLLDLRDPAAAPPRIAGPRIAGPATAPTRVGPPRSASVPLAPKSAPPVRPAPDPRTGAGQELKPPRWQRAVLLVALLAVVGAIIQNRATHLELFRNDPVLGAYGIAITLYILGRFSLSLFYRRPRHLPETARYLPTISIVVPVKNEEQAIIETLTACAEADYPAAKLEVIAVDDGSTDQSLARMREMAARYDGIIDVIALPENRGKRHAMAAGAAVATGEILVFIDSDSLIDRDALKKMVRYFADTSVGAVTGHTDVKNRNVNLITKMQAIHYFVAFRVYKSAESLFSSVTCCSGCFSGYRRSAIEPVIEQWLGQTFLGEPSTYGDDRSLTNFLLPDWRVLYAPDSRAQTYVPERVKVFLRQQLRWKKSWIRECSRAARFMWRKPLPMAVIFYLGLVLPLLAPQMMFRALVMGPLRGVSPWWYAGGVLIMVLFQGLYFRMNRREGLWLVGAVTAVLYPLVLVWQLPYAMATLRDSRWGTR